MAVEIAERPPAAQEPPPVEIRRRRLPSAIWAIPIVAALIGAYLVWVDYTQRGPTITIVFDDATGLVAGKTIVKYKDVEVGKVATVSLNQDLSKINVTAEMHREFAPFLTEGAQFWLVSAQISASGVSGLETLLSGAYVGIDPGPTGGQEKREFAALSEPPLIRSDVPGTEYVLHADKLGGVGRGSIVTFQGFLAGQILGAELSDDRKSTVFRAFVKAPYDELVTRTSRFWNASGFSVAVSSSGMQVDIDSLQTIVAGGVAFDSGAGGDRAAAGTAFPLFDSRKAAEDSIFTTHVEMIAVFDDSVRGLRPGAEVTLRGLRVGTVKDIDLVFDTAAHSFTVPVRLEIEPERFHTSDRSPRTLEDGMRRLKAMVEGGLRAQLQTASLITGDLIVAFDFFPDAPAATLTMQDGVPVIPTVPTQLETLSASLTSVLNKVEGLPLDALLSDMRVAVQNLSALVAAPELRDTLVSIDRAAGGLQTLATSLHGDLGPATASLRQVLDQANAALRDSRGLIAGADRLVDESGPMQQRLDQLLRELQIAARSIRVFADYLERHPEALITGKGAPVR